MKTRTFPSPPTTQFNLLLELLTTLTQVTEDSTLSQSTSDQMSSTIPVNVPSPHLFPHLYSWAQAEETLSVVFSWYGGRGRTGAVADVFSGVGQV